jgi:hypothetical protein
MWWLADMRLPRSLKLAGWPDIPREAKTISLFLRVEIVRHLQTSKMGDNKSKCANKDRDLKLTSK